MYLLPIVYTLGGSPLNVSGISVTIEGLGGEATIDAEAEDFGATNFNFETLENEQIETQPPSSGSRAIDVSGGGRLVLRRIRIINGAAHWGGGLLVQGAGSSLLMERGSVRDSVTTGGSDPDGGGGLQHAQKSLAPSGQGPRPSMFSPGPESETVRTAKGRHALLLHEHRWHRCEEGRERRAGGEHDCRL